MWRDADGVLQCHEDGRKPRKRKSAEGAEEDAVWMQYRSGVGYVAGPGQKETAGQRMYWQTGKPATWRMAR